MRTSTPAFEMALSSQGSKVFLAANETEADSFRALADLLDEMESPLVYAISISYDDSGIFDSITLVAEDVGGKA